MKSILKLTAAALAFAGAAFAEDGVTDTEILIGSNQDMSGPFAAFGAPAVQAANIYFNEVNEAGGIHGRKIRLIVEDHGYQMPKAMSGLNKLVNADKVFAMMLNLGTPMNIAAFPLMESKGIPNIGPLTAARQMNEPPAPFKFAGTSSYHQQMLDAVAYMKENEGSTTACSMFIPTDFGKEIQEGAKDAAAANGMTYAAETQHKPDEQDFVGSLGKLQAAGCDLVAVALGVRQVITVLGTAKKMGLADMKFVGSSASFHTAIAKVPGGITEGFFAAAGWSDLVARMGDPEVAAWVKSYTEATGETFPGTGALLGRSTAETVVRALEAAGPDLTREGMIAAMETLDFDDKIAGTRVTYGPGDHQGADDVIISKIVGENWQEVARK